MTLDPTIRSGLIYLSCSTCFWTEKQVKKHNFYAFKRVFFPVQKAG
jgi:hypothetical protein